MTLRHWVIGSQGTWRGNSKLFWNFGNKLPIERLSISQKRNPESQGCGKHTTHIAAVETGRSVLPLDITATQFRPNFILIPSFPNIHFNFISPSLSVSSIWTILKRFLWPNCASILDTTITTTYLSRRSLLGCTALTALRDLYLYTTLAYSLLLCACHCEICTYIVIYNNTYFVYKPIIKKSTVIVIIMVIITITITV